MARTGGLCEYLAGLLAGRVFNLWDAILLYLLAGQVRGPGDDAQSLAFCAPRGLIRNCCSGVDDPI